MKIDESREREIARRSRERKEYRDHV